MEQRKAFLPEQNKRISAWLKSLFDIVTVENFNEANLLVFPGGLDVDPNLYNEPSGQRTSYNEHTDATWCSYYKTAIKGGIKVMGICKGAQFVNVMAGCPLIQHVNNHALLDTHSITAGGKIYDVTSTHHQMMFPFSLQKDDFELLAYSTEKRSDTYLNGYDDESKPPPYEPEAVFFKGNGSLAIQFHPEFMSFTDLINDEINEWIDKLFKYEITEFFDKYNQKTSYKEFKKSTSESIDLGDVPVEVFEDFVNKYLK